MQGLGTILRQHRIEATAGSQFRFISSVSVKFTQNKPEHFGNFLHPNSLNDTKDSNTPCNCAWVKWLHFNRPNLSKGKISKIKKRIQKALKKIDEKEHNVSQFNSSNDIKDLSASEVERLNKDSKLPPFTNLIGLKLMIMSAEITPQPKR